MGVNVHGDGDFVMTTPSIPGWGSCTWNAGHQWARDRITTDRLCRRNRFNWLDGGRRWLPAGPHRLNGLVLWLEMSGRDRKTHSPSKHPNGKQGLPTPGPDSAGSVSNPLLEEVDSIPISLGVDCNQPLLCWQMRGRGQKTMPVFGGWLYPGACRSVLASSGVAPRHAPHMHGRGRHSCDPEGVAVPAWAINSIANANGNTGRPSGTPIAGCALSQVKPLLNLEIPSLPQTHPH